MSYTPKTEEQLAKEGLLPNGTYDIEVAETSDKPSKKGSEMITLKLNVFDREGAIKAVFDYIVPNTNFGERKLRHAADCFGLLDIYNSGNLKADDFLNKTGKAEIKQQEGNSDYPLPKNVVSDYIGRSGNAQIKANERIKGKPKTTAETLSDDIPF